ncbi:MAG: LuxR family transcriptional regulator [Sedimentibacter sp.]|uniref:LuxR family transcriptional regulator n=1 Tax=Sedimentibacter sp. TaxID=1960295 RepID=UPI0031580EBC
MSGDEKHKIYKLNERDLSVLVFSLFFSWLLAFPFEGQVLYAYLDKYDMYASRIIFESIIAHLIGMLICSYFVRDIEDARKVIKISIAVCIAGTLIFFVKTIFLWRISLVVCSFMAGSSVAAWGFYYKEWSKSNERIYTAADILIFSNILMIAINVTAINLSVNAGIFLSLTFLSAAYVLLHKLPKHCDSIKEFSGSDCSKLKIKKPLILLCIFIVIITINAGLMYQVINPEFEHLKLLTSWYWAVPYIAAIYVVKRLPEKTSRTYALYVSIAMIGLSFISFMVLDRSAGSYILIDTLMMGAFGVYDLFWWSIIGEMLDYTVNPSRIVGIGLSANVLGVLVGGMTGSAIRGTSFSSLNSSILALIIVFVILIILPVLHNQLSRLLKNHAYLTSVQEGENNHEIEDRQAVMNVLTGRENEIVDLLLKGRTYKMIAEELYLSENTVKTHIKNIYSKLGIKSKTELIRMFVDKTI